MRITRLLRVPYQNNQPTVGENTRPLIVPFDVRRIIIKNIIYHSAKNVPTNEQEFLAVKSNLIDYSECLGFVFNYTPAGVADNSHAVFEFKEPRRIAGNYTFGLYKSDDTTYTGTTGDVLSLLIEFDNEVSSITN